MSKDKRPKIVKNFEVIELSILGLGIINAALQYDALIAIFSPFFVMFVQTFTFFVLLWIILAITRQKSSFAKWLLVFSSVISVPIYIPSLSFAMHNSLIGLIAIGQLVLTLVGLYYLFTPEFKMYLKPQKKDNHALSKEDYTEALNEFENKRDEQLWTKYFAESDGDENKAKARYLKDRAEILSKEDKNQVDNLSYDEKEKSWQDVEGNKDGKNELTDEERENMYQSVKDYKDGKL